MNMHLCATCTVREVASVPDKFRVRAIGYYEKAPLQCRCGLIAEFVLRKEDGEEVG